MLYFASHFCVWTSGLDKSGEGLSILRHKTSCFWLWVFIGLHDPRLNNNSRKKEKRNKEKEQRKLLRLTSTDTSFTHTTVNFSRPPLLQNSGNFLSTVNMQRFLSFFYRSFAGISAAVFGENCLNDDVFLHLVKPDNKFGQA